LPDLFATAMALNPTGRTGTPEEIVRSAVFMSSPASSRTSSANIRHRWSVVAGCAALIVDGLKMLHRAENRFEDFVGRWHCDGRFHG
jgi:NAD(P)-dependent dehydrogenase (short-subunit alcohol dehydrogenase family)